VFPLPFPIPLSTDAALRATPRRDTAQPPARRGKHRREQIRTHNRARKQPSERILVEERRRRRDRDRTAVVHAIDRERRQAYERVAEERDPPCKRVAAGLLDLRSVEGELRLLVDERADVGVGVPDRRAREAPRIGTEPSPRTASFGAQSLPVEEQA
jgi:hypothetical protein